MPTENNEIVLKKDDGIATITLNRPNKLNAFNPAMMMDMVDAVTDVGKDSHTRVLVIRAEGKAFSTGQDTSALGDRSQWTSAENIRFLDNHPMIKLASLMRGLDKPVITAVQGIALGGGFALALCSDIRIASESAVFEMTYSRLGISPDMGLTYILPQIVGISKALELLVLPKSISSKQAEQIGLVSKVVPDDQLLNVTMELATSITQLPPFSIACTKRAFYRGLHSDLDSQIEYENRMLTLTRKTEDHKEALRALAEKRKPEFTGK